MRFIYLIILLFTSLISYTQPFNYSGYVYNGNEVGIQNIPVKLYGKRTDPYDITFPSYPSGLSYTTGTVVASSDDVTHGPFNIGFTFTFFGNNYTQFYIGSNGWIGFSANQTTGYTAQYLPNSGSPKNVIMADWEDLFPGSTNIYYTTVGTAPNRKLIVSFNSVPHYGCRSNLHTFQFVLYESTNIIDINYASKPLCGSNNSTAGLVNIDNTNVVPVGDKNASLWSVNNYSVRFTPSAAETNFSLKNTYYTDVTGKYTINPGLDAQSFIFEIRIESLTIPSLTTLESKYPLNIILNNTTLNSKLYYLQDVNKDSKITVTDSYLIYKRMNNVLLSWPNNLPDYRIFTTSEWNIIKNSTLDLRTLYPGVQTITISSPVNNGSSNFYLLKTGYQN